MLPTIADVTTLSDEVRSGQVYGVVQLYKVLEDKPAIEKEPAKVFARTYLTEALQTALHQIRRKLAGEDPRGSLVFTGGYGSGKSYRLLALYHAMTHRRQTVRSVLRGADRQGSVLRGVPVG